MRERKGEVVRERERKGRGGYEDEYGIGEGRRRRERDRTNVIIVMLCCVVLHNYDWMMKAHTLHRDVGADRHIDHIVHATHPSFYTHLIDSRTHSKEHEEGTVLCLRDEETLVLF